MGKHNQFNKNLTVFIQLDMGALEYLKSPQAITASLAPARCKSWRMLSWPGGPYAAIEFDSDLEKSSYIKNVELIVPGMEIKKPHEIPNWKFL